MKFTGREQGRDGQGQFLPGMSGNPTGRPKGSKDKRTKVREDLLGPILPEAITQLEKAVRSAEKWAIELVVSYSIPKPRAVDPDELRELEQRLLDLEQIAARKG